MDFLCINKSCTLSNIYLVSLKFWITQKRNFKKTWFREFPIQTSELSISQINFVFCIYCCCFCIVGFEIRKLWNHVVNTSSFKTSYLNKCIKFSLFILEKKVSGVKPKFHTQMSTMVPAVPVAWPAKMALIIFWQPIQIIY